MAQVSSQFGGYGRLWRNRPASAGRLNMDANPGLATTTPEMPLRRAT